MTLDEMEVWVEADGNVVPESVPVYSTRTLPAAPAPPAPPPYGLAAPPDPPLAVTNEVPSVTVPPPSKTEPPPPLLPRLA